MSEKYYLKQHNDIKYIACAALSRFDFIVHGFATRLGGVSGGACASLNMGRSGFDSAENIRQNRRRFCEALDIGAENLCLVKQVHSKRVIAVKSGDLADIKTNPPEADALVTDQPGIALGILTADCLPMIVAHSGTGAVGIVHAGWRGTAQLIVQEAVLTMLRLYGGQAGNIWAASGPCIGPECYQVGDDVAEVFMQHPGDWSDYLHRQPQGWKLSLARANRAQLLALGVPAAQINIIPFCTLCRQDLFFSHRGRGADGETGRLLSAVMIRG